MVENYKNWSIVLKTTMAKTIEQQAEEYAEKHCYIEPKLAYMAGCVQGATNQLKRDIENACKAYCSMCQYNLQDSELCKKSKCRGIETIKKALEDKQ